MEEVYGVKNSKLLVGVFLVLFGLICVANTIFNLHLFSRIQFWPFIIILVGLCFEIGYFSSGKAPGLLVPGGILLTIGILFLFETWTYWRFAAYTWPIYPFSVAVGLFQLYLFGTKERGLLIPVFILTAVTVIAFICMFFGNIFRLLNYSLLLPVLMIVVGLYVIYKSNVFRK